MSALAELRGVSRTFPGPPPVQALRSCTLAVDRRDFVAVVGPSGSGKSTLLNLLGLIDRPTGGTILLDGVDTASLADDDLTGLRATLIGFVFQSFHLLAHRTAAENVELGMLYQGVPRRVRAKRAIDALDAVGLGHRHAASPSTMSGGERQRVAIARALATENRLLLCDEPTGNLDSGTSSAVMDLVADLHRERELAVVVITHDPEVAARAARVVQVRDGVLDGGAAGVLSA